jgi:uncharacterized membrane protein YfcA
MDSAQIALAAAVGFAVSIISASVGGTALVMVPLLIAFDIEPRNAIATNKFAIMFLSVAATLRFRRSVTLPPARIMGVLAIPVVIGSVVGALLVVRAPTGITRLIIAMATIVVAVVVFTRKDAGLVDRSAPVTSQEMVRSLLVLLPLSVYGGFFTGGYAMLLTYVLVLTMGFSFLQGAAGTRLLSICSAAAASVIFAWEGVIDYRLAVALCASYFAGATLGTHIAVKKGSRWLKLLFLGAAIVLALRLLVVGGLNLAAD